jgi:hypothetical protein
MQCFPLHAAHCIVISAGNEDVVHNSRRYVAVNRSSRDGGADSSKESDNVELHVCGDGSISSRISLNDQESWFAV